MTQANMTNLERANKITVQVTGNGFQADFYRTHKHLAILTSSETGWQADPNDNKTAQREAFRKHAISVAPEYGIDYDPEDKRTPANTRVQAYFSDEILKLDVQSLMQHDLPALIAKMPMTEQVTAWRMAEEDMVITPKTKTGKGTDLSTLGVLDGKYLKSGNWAWANIEATVTISFGEQEIYQLLNVELVSGQLKKPHLTQTAWNESITASLKEAGLLKEQPKAENTGTGYADAEHEGLHEDYSPEEEARLMVEAEKVLAEMDKAKDKDKAE